MRKVAFIGPMGSGKSTLAKAYAAKLCLTAVDTDEEFTRRHGEINAFFEREGESAFRKLEAEVVSSAVKSNAEVVACGGGVVENKRSMDALKAECDIVYLRAEPSVLSCRIRNSARPLEARAKELFDRRKPLYEKYADYIIDSDGTVESGLARLIGALNAPRKNRYDAVLCDADDTVLDFQAAMRYAMVSAAREIGAKSTDDEVVAGYERILPVVWGKLERGEITRQQLATMRFVMLKTELNESFDSDEFNSLYVKHIKTTRFVRDGAVRFLDEVRAKGVRVYIITNSDKAIAAQRLKALDGHTDGAFVSEDIGFDKPDVRFFEAVQKEIGIDKSKILVFGDGVNPDIRGGAAFGADTCLYDPDNKKHCDEANFTVRGYDEVLRIL